MVLARLIPVLLLVGCSDGFNRRQNCQFYARDARAVEACLLEPKCSVTAEELRIRNYVINTCGV
jgi:hypothetical protein